MNNFLKICQSKYSISEDCITSNTFVHSLLVKTPSSTRLIRKQSSPFINENITLHRKINPAKNKHHFFIPALSKKK